MTCEIIWQKMELAYWAGLHTAGLTSDMKIYFWTQCVCMV